MVQWVKLTLVMHGILHQSAIWILAALLLIQFLTNAPGKQWWMVQTVKPPTTSVGDQDGAPGSWLHSGPARAGKVISGVSHRSKSITLTFSQCVYAHACVSIFLLLCLSNKQILKKISGSTSWITGTQALSHHFLLPRHINKKLDWKQSSQYLNHASDMGRGIPSHDLTCFTTMPTVVIVFFSGYPYEVGRK